MRPKKEYLGKLCNSGSIRCEPELNLMEPRSDSGSGSRFQPLEPESDHYEAYVLGRGCLANEVVRCVKQT